MPPKTGLGRPTSTTLVNTPNVARIRELMNQALDLMDPLEFRFTAAKFGSLAASKERATSLQNQVNSIRARARNIAQVQAGQKNSAHTGEQIKGQYDDLACSKRLLPNSEGYVVLIGRSPEDEFEIYNHRTGERILYEDPRTKRRNQLIDHWTERLFNDAVSPPYFTYEQEREMYDLDPETFRAMFETSNLPLPTWLSGLDNLAGEDDAPEIDLLDTPIEDFGV